MNRLELRMKYKAETSGVPVKFYCDVRVVKFGDVILDGNDLGDDFKEMIGLDGERKWMEFPDLDYIKWLEEKLMEVLK